MCHRPGGAGRLGIDEIHAAAAAGGWAATGVVFVVLLLLPYGVGPSARAIYHDDWW